MIWVTQVYQCQNYNEKGFEIFAISLDRTKEAWLKAIEDNELNWLNVMDTSNEERVSEKYGVSGIPTNFLLDKDGKIIAQNLERQELNELLEGLLK